MSDFKREKRYIVIKQSDVERYLNIAQKRVLNMIQASLECGRQDDNRGSLVAAVVEHDWPEYEPTWKAIEQRVNDKSSPLNPLDIL